MRLLFTPVVYGPVGKRLLSRTRNFPHRPARVVLRSAVRPVRLSMHGLCGLELLEDDVCFEHFQNALSQCNHSRRRTSVVSCLIYVMRSPATRELTVA